MSGLLVEPPGAHLRGDAAARPLSVAPAGTARVAALVAAVALAATSTGDVFVLCALLAALAWERFAAVTTILVGVAATARWGTTGLPGIAGAQAVLGPGVLVGPAVSATACGLAAVALVLATPSRAAAVPFGIAAAAVAAGPAAAGMSAVAVRVLASAIAIGLSLAAVRLLGGTAAAHARRVAALTCSAAAVAAALVGSIG